MKRILNVIVDSVLLYATLFILLGLPWVLNVRTN